MNIIASYKTDTGTFRKNNQDSLLFLKNKTGQVLAVVCDGLGGHSCGDIASSMAVSLLKEFFNETKWLRLQTDEQVHQWLNTSVLKIQSAMNQYSLNNEEANDMGTTMVITLITNRKAYLVNIGDSRIYLFNNQGLKQLTSDHNILNLYLKNNPKQVADVDVNQTYWKALTSALGPIKNLTIDIFDLSFETPSYFLLTSDGVHDFLEETEITHILEKNNSLKAKVKMLIKQAINNVSTDNLSAILMLVKD
ncbi:Protein phosphatase PrpC [Spiroplasma sp. JKS002669]|uniref:PP2C family protein-serine/threonine phosphatase n=1 Tax=Spiroplasma attinicola TaxID=2904537 RepID=UPI002022F00C|nr:MULTISPECIES: protein phosphatase 2C domain-containing protein [unclassified Spiroplasma]MCL6428507.1 Protein phosphatase PrpC [Spiroplasma sp. JKS002669]MCL8209841.1 Protein phosphatase PrpC [Spiroplasma sp. JKS002670]MCL8210802.1 Protein phosphatase PrpC [Spiroplasma sp. JKS002671]